MSKKNKNKFKKQIKAQMLQEMSQVKTSSVPLQKEQIQVNQIISEAEPLTTIEKKEFNLPQIKYDLKKTLIIVLILALLIVGLYFADLKYNLLVNFGSWLFRILNIQK